MVVACFSITLLLANIFCCILTSLISEVMCIHAFYLLTLFCCELGSQELCSRFYGIIVTLVDLYMDKSWYWLFVGKEERKRMRLGQEINKTSILYLFFNEFLFLFSYTYVKYWSVYRAQSSTLFSLFSFYILHEWYHTLQ